MSQGNLTSSTISPGDSNSSVASSADDFGGQEHPSVLFEFIIPGVLLNTIGEVEDTQIFYRSATAKLTKFP